MPERNWEQEYNRVYGDGDSRPYPESLRRGRIRDNPDRELIEEAVRELERDEKLMPREVRIAS